MIQKKERIKSIEIHKNLSSKNVDKLISLGLNS